ncbi:MAG TPA: ABC transporter substrate-binding protein [Dehalococcoidia bacterium]|nr:ABC transporter substrate-binding protein [Dehalococcoidia bacterium]
MAAAANDRTLKLGIVARSHYSALKDGSVNPRGINLEIVEVSPMPRLFDRMIADSEFDVSEMAIVTYLQLREFNLPFTAIPVFPFRAFPQGTMLVNVNAGVATPKDLEGKKIGVRAYAGTAGVWARGLLQSEYGVDPFKVKWLVNDQEHIGEYHNPSNVEYIQGANLGEMLVNGEIAAGIGLMGIDSPDVKPLIGNARQAQEDWFKKTGVYPMNNTVVIRNDVLALDPSIAEAMLEAFSQAKESYLKRLKENGPQARDEEGDAPLAELLGDPLPVGVEANRRGLEQIITSGLTSEDLFAENTRDS